MKGKEMKLSKSSCGIFLLWLFIFSFLGLIFNLMRSNEKEQNKIVIAKEIRTETPIIKSVPVFPTVQSDIDLSNAIHEEIESNIIKSNSKHAYVTLMHGIDNTFGYRGFLYNALLAKQSLKTLGSTADFIVLIGFSGGVNPNDELINKDLELMKEYEIILYFLPRLLTKENHKNFRNKVDFAEMALLKITPFSFTQYESIQFFDGDVLPYKNMDCLFKLPQNTYNTGSASPLNSGWYLAIPNVEDHESMKVLAIERLTRKWDEKKGWGTPIPPKLFYRGSDKEVKKWDFNGASLDQGLMTHYFVLNNGRAQLLDVKNARQYNSGYKMSQESVTDALSVCSGNGGSVMPMDMFYHYTGRNKPWMNDLKKPKDKSLLLWATLLDSMKLSVNSSNINDQNLKAPLGFFHPNK